LNDLISHTLPYPCLLGGPPSPLGGTIFSRSAYCYNTKSAGQALRVSLVKPGAYLSLSYDRRPTSSHRRGGNDAQAVGGCGLLWGSDETSYVPWGVLSFEVFPIVSISRDRRLAHFAILVFFGQRASASFAAI